MNRPFGSSKLKVQSSKRRPRPRPSSSSSNPGSWSQCASEIRRSKLSMNRRPSPCPSPHSCLAGRGNTGEVKQKAGEFAEAAVRDLLALRRRSGERNEERGLPMDRATNLLTPSLSSIRWRRGSSRPWSLVIGHWPLVIGHWSLVIGHWPLVIGPWSLELLLNFEL